LSCSECCSRSDAITCARYRWKRGVYVLSSLYADLSRGMDPTLRGHKSVYYDHVELSASSLDKMDWWFLSLQSDGLSQKSQPSVAKIFSLNSGDGNGTGTGETGFSTTGLTQPTGSWGWGLGLFGPLGKPLTGRS
jgi:hypothetical protein